MLTTISYKINISETDAIKMPIYDKPETVYDKEKEELTFKVNQSSGECFRLVYNDKEVLTLFEAVSKTITETIYTMEEFLTEKLALDRIKELGLSYIPAEELDKDGN